MEQGEVRLNHEGYTIGIIESESRGWFERDRDGYGGGLWFDRVESEDGSSSHLELMDYDGVFELPKPVLFALKAYSIYVGDEFE